MAAGGVYNNVSSLLSPPLCRDASHYPAPGPAPAPPSCSDYSTRRGPGQRVVAFSYYEPDLSLASRRLETGEVEENKFLEGIGVNIARVQEFYPGWYLLMNK